MLSYLDDFYFNSNLNHYHELTAPVAFGSGARMRRFQCGDMIISVLSYVFFPLSRYLSRRFSADQAQKEPLFSDAHVAEVSHEGLRAAVVDGTAAWDGGLARSQSTPLDQCLRPRRAAGDTEERMTEPSPERGGNKTPGADEERLASALHEEANREAATGTSEVQAAVMDGDQQQEDRESAGQEDGTVTVHEVLHMKPSPADGTDCPAEGQSSEQALTHQLMSLHTEDDADNISSPQQHIQIHDTEESLAPPVATAATEASECWDEYEVQIAGDWRDGAGGSEPPQASVSSDAPVQVNLDGPHDAPAGCCLPAPAHEMQCSLWQVPAGSYYPPVEQLFPFEIIWRVWEELDSCSAAAQSFTKNTMNFTVMSYNILAQDLLEANEDLYRHSPLRVLEWSSRCTLLVKEIQKWAPDILCLQEVQENHYNEHLHPVFAQMGYTCVYKRRTGTKTDGCAVCYRSSCFCAVSLAQLEFFKPETELLDRHNVGIVLLLQPVVSQGSAAQVKGPALCVANTHLLFNPRRGDVKLAQLALMLAEIDRAVKSCKARGQHCNVILCGDFNSVPHMPLYQLITTGHLYYHGLPTWMISGQEDLSYKTHCHRLFAPLWPSSLGITDNCQYASVNDLFESHHQESGKCRYSHDFMLQLRYCPAACVRPADLNLIPGVTDNTPDASSGNQPYGQRSSGVVTHRLDLESVYQHVLPGSGSSEVTTLNSGGGATVDYIFYSPQRVVSSEPEAGGEFVSRGLKLSGRLSLLSEDVLWGMNGLPNDTFPSDHLCLLAQFQLDLDTV
ncbi:protein angel homolog 1 [Betta splendens]|uniref:Protein angel homolog 1 n=1 Tax=Betta splendens TaxID=158456 RepID=A0A6P7LK85_BETSP|nr:protein angel homolog 1 [Betta splendens]